MSKCHRRGSAIALSNPPPRPVGSVAVRGGLLRLDRAPGGDVAVVIVEVGGEGILGRGLRRSELDRPTPYNTYVIPALPPTPIANPGRASIEAALNPDTTDFVFFVADGTGGHAFATNLDDHNRNVAAWRAIEAQQSTTDSN